MQNFHKPQSLMNNFLELDAAGGREPLSVDVKVLPMFPEPPRTHAIWDTVLTACRLYCSDEVYRDLILAAHLDDYDHKRETVVVQIPNAITRRQFERDAVPALKRAFLNALGVEPRVFVEEVDPNIVSFGKAHAQSSAQALADANESASERPSLPAGMNPNYTLDRFMQGPANQLALSACQSVIENPGSSYNPLYIHGGVGLGKTHLLQGVVRALMDKRPDLRVRYLSCETFVNDFLEALSRDEQSSFRAKFRDIDVLVMDDIQFLSGKDKSQDEFFHTFNSLYNAGRQIVISADCQPKELKNMEERLISRFVWGLPARLDPPDVETREKMVADKARRRGVNLPEDVVEFIAKVVTTNVRELEGAVIQVAAMATMQGRPVSLAVAREALGHVLSISSARRTTLVDIVNVVCEDFGVRYPDLQSQRRTRAVTVPRQIAMYLVKELTDKTLEEIGGVFGGRDHSTVLHSIRKVSKLVKSDTEFAGRIEGLRFSLTQGRS